MENINSDILACLIEMENAIESSYLAINNIREGIKALGFTDKEIDQQKAKLKEKITLMQSKLKGGEK